MVGEEFKKFDIGESLKRKKSDIFSTQAHRFEWELKATTVINDGLYPRSRKLRDIFRERMISHRKRNLTWCSVWLAAGCFIGSDIGEILHFESTISIEEKVDSLGRRDTQNVPFWLRRRDILETILYERNIWKKNCEVW